MRCWGTTPGEGGGGCHVACCGCGGDEVVALSCLLQLRKLWAAGTEVQIEVEWSKWMAWAALLCSG
jgi:hypothetical protein